MNVAELEAALIELESESKFRRDSAYDELAHHAASLARRVIAAEKLADAVRYDLSCWPDTMVGSLRDVLQEYEATQ